MGAQKGHSEVCEMLIDYKVDKNHNTYYQPSPLHAAAENGHSEVCTILLFCLCIHFTLSILQWDNR